MLHSYISQIPCHRKLERSYHSLQKYIPLCARCTGILLGFLLFPIYFLISHTFILVLALSFFAQVPLLIDGFTQKWGWRSSTNVLRVSTGFLSGNGMALLISSSISWIIS
nr:DUF2085 domain-containing protein [Bacillus sp. 491mf]